MSRATAALAWLVALPVVPTVSTPAAADPPPGAGQPEALADWPAWPRPDLRPPIVYAQIGRAERATSAGVGLSWPGATAVPCAPAGSRCSWRLDAEAMAWSAPAGSAGERRTGVQVGLTPVWRQSLAGSGSGAWFAELGLGTNFFGPLYRNGDRRFSTSLNFGSQFAVGRSFGAQGEHEVSVRIEHFSNAGLRDPNPGDNFLQVRWQTRR